MQIKRQAVFLSLLFLSGIATSQTNEPLTRFFNPSSVNAPKGYSQSVIIDLGNCYMVMLSGQVALDSIGNLIGEGNFEKQAEQVFLNIKNILIAAGGSTDNLVKINYYLVNVENIQTLRKIRDSFINVIQPPASTLVQVSKLFRNDLLLEIDATAVIQK